MPPPYRADQIGSLLRPTELLAARSSLASPSQMYDISDDELMRRAEQEAIVWAVSKQLELSILPFVSGEYSRHMFYAGFFEKLEGMTPMPKLPIVDGFRTDFPTTTKLADMGATTRAAVVCTGPIRWKESSYMEEWKALRSFLPRNLWSSCKITLPSPSYQHIQLKPGTAFTRESGYTSDEQYFKDLGAAYTSEIRALYDEGCRNLQIDDPNLTYFCSSQFLEGAQKDGTDTEALLDLYLEAYNMFLEDLPGDDLQMGVHLCRGNMSGSTHFVSGSYELVAQKLFNKTKFENFYLEFDDTVRQGGFEPLRFLPRDKNVVLGLVSTKKAELESMDSLIDQVYKAADVIAKAQGVSKEEALQSLSVSPQCGFSSSSLAGGTGMTFDGMWKKLVLVRDVARDIWPDAR